MKPPSRPGEPLPFIQIFASDRGIRSIDSPLKVRILEMLAGGEMDFETIVSGSGRAKSTISAHLKALADAGVVTSWPDPADARRRLVCLNGRFLVKADLSGDDAALTERYLPLSVRPEAETPDFYRFILTTIRISLLVEGISIDPILARAGERAGSSLYSAIRDPDLDVMLDNVQAYWSRYRLGSMEVERLDPPTLVIRDCFECMDLPILGKPVCAFDSGILSSIFSNHFGERHLAVETRCYAMGSNLCRFEILQAS